MVRETSGSSPAGPPGRVEEAATYPRTALAVLGILAMGCSIPVGTAGDLRLVPSVRPDDLASGFSAGGNIMGLNLGFAVGARCLGLVGGMQGNGRCVGVGVGKDDDEENEKKKKEVEAKIAPVALAKRTETPEKLAAAPKIKDDGKDERGVSGGVKLFGLGLGASMSGGCVGVTTALDGEGRCLGVGLRPKDEIASKSDESRTAPSAGTVSSGATTQTR